MLAEDKGEVAAAVKVTLPDFPGPEKCKNPGPGDAAEHVIDFWMRFVRVGEAVSLIVEKDEIMIILILNIYKRIFVYVKLLARAYIFRRCIAI